MVALSLIIAAGFLTFNAWQEFEKSSLLFPENSHWGEVDVSGLTIDEAQQRVLAVYLSPIELRYEDEVIQVTAETLGFRVDFSDPLENGRFFEQSFSFWSYLWSKPRVPVDVPIEFSLDEAQVRLFLQNEIAPRYDTPSIPPLPVPSSSRFTYGIAGRYLDIEASILRIKEILNNLSKRQVELVVREQPVNVPDIGLLKAVLINELQEAKFNGIAEIYAFNLTQELLLHFAVDNGEEVPTDIAFSAASTIKIPILLTAMLDVQPPFPDEFTSLAERMMVYSENPPADRIMETYIGSTLAPLKVTEFLQQAGFRNTFLAGYFYLGAPLLRRFETPANQRLDINLKPDVYNQTTAGDMGRLLEEIYRCTKTNGGLLVETFAGQMSAEKCTFLLEKMKQNRIGVLGQAGLPEGLPFAHKHGWSEESDGFLHTISDVGVVFGPQSDYVLVIFLYDRTQLLFEPANALMARLSQRIFNAWNLDYQVEWNFAPVQYR